MRRLSAIFLAAALTLTAACSSGDKDSSGGADGPSRSLFQPAGVVGPDSFAPTFAVASYDVDPSMLSSGEVSGSAPGLYAGRTYGGTGTNICDVEAMIRFLTYYEDRGRAWAEIQGIEYSELASYLRSLTPVFALQNLNVQMFGFKNGSSYGYDAVIAAGTAILVDDQGMPRARCACGNPLLGPSEDTPDGTDEPPTTDGNPETQDSVPGDSTPEQPGDSVSVDSVPTDSVPEDSVPPTDEPECPDWNIDPVTYTDPSGMVWIYDRSTDTWFSTTDADLFKVPTIELPGYLELCDEPGQRQPGGDCPEPFRGSWTDYYASNGDVWRWEFTSPETGYWVNQNGDIVNFLVDIPSYLEDCGDPRYTYEPECPEPMNSVATLDWTPYYASNGDVWIYDPATQTWTSQNTGAVVTGADPSAIPGYLEDCGEPPVGDDPCPPTKARVGDSWTDPETGETWIFDYVATADGRSAIRWTNTTTGEQLDDFDLYLRECGEPATPKVVCPPTYAPFGTVWVDTTGEEWVFAAGSGGVTGWDQVSTSEIEALTYAELPNKPSGCPEPFRPVDCPPVANVPEGYVWFGTDGDVYRYSTSAGGWSNETDPAGQVVPYTVLLPGYSDSCLPPCPPVNVHETNEFAIWVDPSTGEVWVKFPQSNSWTNVDNGQSRTYTTDLPFYTEDCLPPCDPESDGQSTYVTGDDGSPETNPDKVAQYGDADDTAVTVTPSSTGATIQPIVEQRVVASTADGDDCNPEGCVAPDVEPELGHAFRGSDGVLWRYVGNGTWRSESGDFVDDVLDIPGYARACLPGDTPVTRECPPEFEGSQYTDTNGLVWMWVGSHATPEESDHGQYWFHRYEDGSTEKRYTFQLETFFADCPRPEGVEVQADAVFVTLRGPSQMCLGEKTDITMTAISSSGAAISAGRISVDGDEMETIDFGAGVYGSVFVPEEAGTFEFVGTATDADGNEGTSTIQVVVVECGDTTDQSGPNDSTPSEPTPVDSTPTEPSAPSDSTPPAVNTAPVVEVSIDPACVEGESQGTTEVRVKITVVDIDGDELSVSLRGGSPDRSLPPLNATVAGSGSRTFAFAIDYRDRLTTFTFKGTADDGENLASDSASITVENPGGCDDSADAPSSSTSTTTAAPKESSTTVAPNSPGRLQLDTKCVELGSQGTGSVSFTIIDPDGLKSVSVSPSTFTVKGSLSTGKYAASPITKADAGKTLVINVVDGKGVSGSYKLIVPAICG